jgi:hypothetical protein
MVGSATSLSPVVAESCFSTVSSICRTCATLINNGHLRSQRARRPRTRWVLPVTGEWQSALLALRCVTDSSQRRMGRPHLIKVISILRARKGQEGPRPRIPFYHRLLISLRSAAHVPKDRVSPGCIPSSSLQQPRSKRQSILLLEHPITCFFFFTCTSGN